MTSFAIESISSGPSFLKSCRNVFAGQSRAFPTINPIKIYYARQLGHRKNRKNRKNDQKFGNSCLLGLTWLSFVFNASVVIDWPKNKTRCFFRLSTISVLTYSRHLSGTRLLCRSNAMLNHLGKHLNTIAFIAAILAGSQRSKNLNHRSFTTDGTWNTGFDSKRFNEVWRSF